MVSYSLGQHYKQNRRQSNTVAKAEKMITFRIDQKIKTLREAIGRCVGNEGVLSVETKNIQFNVIDALHSTF
jgi:hypothetical protein